MDRYNVAIRVRVGLTADQACCGFMSNGVEKTVESEVRYLTSLDIISAKGVQEVTITFGFGSNGIP